MQYNLLLNVTGKDACEVLTKILEDSKCFGWKFHFAEIVGIDEDELRKQMNSRVIGLSEPYKKHLVEYYGTTSAQPINNEIFQEGSNLRFSVMDGIIMPVVKKLSILYPNNIFTLHHQSEEDVCGTYVYSNGKIFLNTLVNDARKDVIKAILQKETYDIMLLIC